MSQVYFYDIETWGNIFTNTLKDRDTGDIHQCVIHEDGRAEGFIEMMDLYRNTDAWFCGYNNMHFDDRIIQYILDNYRNWKRSGSLYGIPQKIYRFAQECVDDETRKYQWGNDVQFRSIDMKRVGYLDKSLKMVATNLEWPLIKELPFSHKDNPQLSDLPEILEYNLNDVEITERLYEELERNVKLRAYMSTKYNENLMSDSDSGIAHKLLNKLYAKASGENYWNFKDGRTKYDSINLGSLIDHKINFNKPQLEELVQQMHDTTLQNDGNDKFDKFEYHVEIGDTQYKIAKGGIHSENSYELYESNDEYTYFDLDFSSYYPYIMVNLGIYPRHLKKAFIGMFEAMVDERISFKKAGKYVESDALKIVINAVYGKLGSKRFWLYDPAALYGVTINGQLFILMLIERMEEAGFPVIYANTDGIIVKVKNDKVEDFRAIYKAFEHFSGFDLDDEKFDKLVIRDVNNLLIRKADGSIKRKGELNKNRHKGSWGMMRSFHKPIVPIAIEEFFFNDTPVVETIENYEEVMDFCMAQKADKKFTVMRRYIQDGEVKIEELQRTNRYFVSDPRGDVIFKKKGDREISMGGTAGEHTLLFNKPDQYGRDRVDDSYYIKEARKVIEPFLSQQGSLF